MRSRIVWSLALVLGCADEMESATPFTPSTTVPTDESDDGNDSDDDDDDSGTDGETGDRPTDDGSDDDHGDDGSSDAGDDSGTTADSTDDGGDPNCYSEPLDPAANVDDIVGSYGGAGYKTQVIEAMQRRWPAGAWLLQERIDDPYWAQFSDSSSWAGMVGWLDTLVHEQTHLFNAYHAIDVGQNAALFFREDKILYLPTDEGFARSEILQHLIPEAQNGIYSGTYLTGSQGERQFNELLDEANCYANEVPGMSVFGEYFDGFGLSLRDGSAAFLYFIEVYLRVGRTEHPEWYAWAKTQPVYLEAVELLWLRTHFFYEEVADGFPSLGIDDAVYRAAAYEPENLAELNMFTGKVFDASSCVAP